MRRFIAKLGNFFRHERADEDLSREVTAHLTLLEDEYRQRGLTPDEARFEAKRAYGGVEQAKELQREERSFLWLEQTRQDVRSAFRTFRKSPGFTAVALLSLALGIGANTAIFSFVNAILLKSLPVPHPDELVSMAEWANNREVSTVLSYPTLQELEKRSDVLQGLFGRFQTRVSVMRDGAVEALTGEIVTGGYFRTLQVHAALGRLLDDSDIVPSVASPVCVLSYAAWQESFGGDPHILGRKLVLNSRPFTVIGVSERGFFGSRLQSRVDVQVPVSRIGDFLPGFTNMGGGPAWKAAGFKWLAPVARLRPGITRKRAEASLQSLFHVIEGEQSRGQQPSSLRLSDGSQGSPGWHDQYAQPLTILMSVVGLVLLIACANLANLLLAKAVARQKEFAVRLSLGASRGRLIRQLLAENFLLAAGGGTAGLLLSFWITRMLLLFLNTGSSSASPFETASDGIVVAFSVALSCACALLFGLAPAWQSAHPDVLPQLKQVSAGALPVGRHTAMRKALIVFQIALSVVVLFAAGLLTRTLSHLQTVDLGFEPSRVLVMAVDPAAHQHSPAQTDQIFDRILSRLRSQPGVAAASLANIVPLEGTYLDLGVSVPGHAKDGPDVPTGFNSISPGYFATLDQRILAGRDFSERDGRKTPRVAIVNEAFVSQYMPGLNPVGRQVKAAGDDVEIVGVVRTAHYADIRETPQPQVYTPIEQDQTSGDSLLVRTYGSPAAAISNIEHVVHSVDARLPISNVRTLEEQIDKGISSERVLSFLSTLFSLLAVLLCGIGLYGIVAYAVSCRVREIGLRFAIGAQRGDVAWLFLKENLLLTAVGVLVGIPAALFSTGVLKSMLFGLQPTDAGTLVLTVAILMVAGLAATILPVRRAASIEPLTALRHE